MHFSISDTEELLDQHGGAYTSYRLFCNGTFHGSVRYRELYELHELLSSSFSDLPAFPPKKLFHLSAVELSGRRLALEKYLQNLGQSGEILQSAVFHEFLRKIQLRCCTDTLTAGTYSVFLLNGNAVELTVSDPKIHSDELLALVCEEVKLPAELINFFALYLALEEGGRQSVLKKFAPFEVPLAVLNVNSVDALLEKTGGISKRIAPGNGVNGTRRSDQSLRIVLRKSYWDTSLDADILNSSSRVGANLLFVEAVDAVNRGWIVPTPEQKRHLESLQQKGSRREFVQVAQQAKGYGHWHFGPATIDYPSPGTASPTTPYLNGKDLICPLKLPDGQIRQEAVFRVIRMRCWRLCVSDGGHAHGHSHGHSNGGEDFRMSIMFEYLLGRDKLQWITIHSNEAVWISACLQSIVEELMLQKRGLKAGGNGNKPVMLSGRGGEKRNTHRQEHGNKTGTMETLSVSVTVAHNNMVSGNTAFEEIGDDDL